MLPKLQHLSKTLLTAVAGCLIAGAAQAQDLPPVPQDILSKGVLRVGVKCDSPPFGSLDPSGKPVGIEVSMARRIAEFAFGSPDKVDLQCVTSEARIPSLNGQKIDIILATLGKFPERQKVIDFTEYYMWGTSNVMVPKGSPATKLAELKDKNICIVKGGSQAKWLNENIPGIKLTQLNTTSDCIQALRQGRVDGFVGDGGLVWSLSSNYPELRVIEEGLDLGFNAIGLRKGEKELQAFLDAALIKMKKEGYYEKIIPEFVNNPVVLRETLKSFQTQPPAPPRT
ncbi:amino acid ABC transporter substrate-binding protein [Microvirga sp. KLBC 81]|uniref:transporter substrate-binding domain-containing protein n=1 Tax=Microvirga sp. KLBC 81 TaxID=1862707 RepID=UPI000D523EAC|nr:transporter substrate-binding domain-containing protein [Microvirga sp. KLBC 81]PVE20762.1 amino acid ABC transporter substrate-binding protein [Microvirga sp. KLBC 81]